MNEIICCKNVVSLKEFKLVIKSQVLSDTK